jgi:peptide/nickel transport system permease protein
MLSYLARRLSSSLAILFAASIGIFAILRLAPGNPAYILAGPDPSPERIALLTRQFELDKPLLDQYIRWIEGVFTGSLGNSYILNAPISGLILARAGNTIELLVVSMILSLILGGTFGVLAAVSKARLVQFILAFVNTIGLAIPPFVIGILLAVLFAVHLQILPAGGNVSFFDDPVASALSVILPAVTLALPVSAIIARFVQVSVAQAFDEDFVLTARMKGLSQRRIFLRHVLPNALPPIVTITGIQIGQLLGGAVVVEAIFAWPGLGQLAVQAIQSRDYLVVQDLLIWTVLAFILVQTLTDLINAGLDPRVRGVR